MARRRSEAQYERIVRYSDEHGLFILYNNKVYQPVSAGAPTHDRRMLPLGSKFRTGQKVRFTTSYSVATGDRIIVKDLFDRKRRKLFCKYAAAVNVVPWTYAEFWNVVKVKPEGHYHFAC